MPTPSLPSPLPSVRLRVGDCTVDMPLREIHAPGARRPRRVTPKAIAVLAALIEQGGRVVSRDALLAQVWAGTMPTDDVVTQAITQLRKAFDDERGNPRYIETIAKYGYRLLAPVEVLDGPSATASADDAVPADFAPAREPWPSYAPAPEAIRGGWGAIAGALSVAVLVVAVVLAWSLRREPPAAARAPEQGRTAERARFRLITSVPGVERSPSLSPDGALVAYVATPPGRRGSAIMVQTTDPSAPRQLSRPEDDQWDDRPAWSPDGREIAFVRVTPGSRCDVLVLPANGGTARTVASCDPRNLPSFDWAYDGRGLVFGSRGTPTGGAGLRLLDLASGEWRLIDYGATPQDVDFMPRFSPDGRWIVFARNTPVGDLWRIPATGGHAQRLTRLRADIRGWDWTPDGRRILLSRWSGSESRLLEYDIDSDLVSDLGIADAVEPVVARRVPAVAFTESRSYFGIHRLRLDASQPIERMFPSSGRDRLPVVAPDNRQIVFTSDRSGEFALWWSDLERPDSLHLIEGMRPESWHPPVWSGDSRRLLVVGEGKGGSGLYEVIPASGQVLHLPVPDAAVVQAVYLPDNGDRLLVLAGSGSDSGRLRLRLYDRRATPWTSLANIEDVAVARIDTAGQRVLFTRPGQPGLWQADFALSPDSVRQLDDAVPEVAGFRSWNVDPGGRVYYIQRQSDCAAALMVLGQPEPVLCVDRSRRSGPSGFSLGSRGDVMYITLAMWDGGDIGFMMLPTAPEPIGPR